MDYQVSKSEKKRRAKNIEKLAQELVSLSPAEIKKLPCDSWLQKEILDAAKMKAGAKKRQVKYITKNLRSLDSSPLFEFMAEQKGSRLKDKKEFHELEQLRDSIIDDVLAADREAKADNREIDPYYPSASLEAAIERIGHLDEDDLRRSALRYAKTRKVTHSREIFRVLKAAVERQKWQETSIR
jgi:ribosome-associated protein